MKFGICNEMFKGWDIERILSFVKPLGYTGLEIAPFTIDLSVENVAPARRREIREAAEKNGVSVIGTHWLLAKPEGLSISNPDKSVRKKTADYMCRLAEFTSDIGGELMVLGSPKQRSIGEGQTENEVRGYLKEALLPALEICRDRNIDICLEPLTIRETNFINTAGQAISFIRELAHPNLKLHLDVKAMCSEERSIPEIIASSSGYTRHFHVNDPNRKHPGSGEVDYAPIMEALKKTGYAGWLSLEVFDFSPGAENIARENIDYLKKFAW